MIYTNTKESQILVGTILGDATVTPLSVRKQQSQLVLKYKSSSFPYLLWFKEHLNTVLNFNEPQHKKGYDQFYMYSKPSSLLGKHRTLFYPEGRKVLPRNIGDLLSSPIGLAVWYMDDGSLDYREKYHKSATFSTHSFSKPECSLLSDVLKQNFNISSSVHKAYDRSVPHHRIYVPAKSVNVLFSLVEPYILTCFAHKRYFERSGNVLS